MTSYKSVFPDRWLKAEVIAGHRPRVIIEHVRIEKLFNPRTKMHEQKIVIKFHKKDLRLVCNVTHCRSLAQISGSDDYTLWQGHEVVLSTGRAPNGSDTILISPVPDTAAPAVSN
jgi:hypothetical protein